jgi:hypothetical protein
MAIAAIQRTIDREVQKCLAGDPEFVKTTNDIFLRMIRSHSVALFFCLAGLRCPLRRPAIKQKKSLWHYHPEAFNAFTGNLAVVAYEALDPRFCAAIFR